MSCGRLSTGISRKPPQLPSGGTAFSNRGAGQGDVFGSSTSSLTLGGHMAAHRTSFNDSRSSWLRSGGGNASRSGGGNASRSGGGTASRSGGGDVPEPQPSGDLCFSLPQVIVVVAVVALQVQWICYFSFCVFIYWSATSPTLYS